MNQLERDISKFLTLAIYGAVIASILTRGDAAVLIGQVFGDIIKSAFRAAAGQQIT